MFKPGIINYGTPKTYATWNPSDKGANITLSNSNTTLTNPSGTWNSVRATIGKSSGKWYWEVKMDNSVAHIHGVANSSANISSYVGIDANGYGYGLTGLKYNNGTSPAYGAVYTTNDVIGFALDMGAGTITCYLNNVSQGVMFSGLTGTIYPASSSISSSTATANFGATTMTYTAPSGFNQGLYN